MAERYCQKTVETSQPPLNVLPVFIITEQTVLVQSLYVKQRSLRTLHLARTLARLVSADVFENSTIYSTINSFYISIYVVLTRNMPIG